MSTLCEIIFLFKSMYPAPSKLTSRSQIGGGVGVGIGASTTNSAGKFFKTSLKIFKHYKLKPSFSIFKDEKAKDKVGVGDKPPPPSFNNLIKFDPI